MSEPSSSVGSTKPGALRALINQCQTKFGEAWDSRKESLGKTSLKVLGIWGTLEAQRSEHRGLVEKLGFINEHILNHALTMSDMDESTREQADSLRDLVDEVEAFLKNDEQHLKRSIPATNNRLQHLHNRVHDVMLRFTIVRTANVSNAVEQLRSAASGAYADQVPTELPPIDIPAKPNVFCGRDELVELIVLLLLEQEHCHIPLLGLGGIGKTSTALKVINDTRLRAKYGEEIIFVGCDGVVSADGIIKTLNAVLGLTAGPPTQQGARRALLWHLSSKSYTILVLDNLETAWDSADMLNVEDLLAKLSELRSLSLVITMRGIHPPQGVDWAAMCLHPLRPLNLDSARQMWARLGATTDDNLDRLLGSLDGLPLAINLMAHQGRVLSPTELLDAYEQERTALMQRGDDGRLTSLQFSIRLSLKSRSMINNADALDLLSVLCLLPDGTSTTTLRSALPSMRNIWPATLSLLSAALVLKDNERIRVLSPIRDFILSEQPPRNPYLTDVRQYFMKLTAQVDDIGTEHSLQAVRAISSEFGNIYSILLHLWRTPSWNGLYEALLNSTHQLASFSVMTQYGDYATLLYEAKRALHTAGNTAEEAKCTRSIGQLMLMQNRYEEGTRELQDAKNLFTSVGDGPLAAQCARSLGVILRLQNRLDEASTTLLDAKASFMSLGDSLGTAQCTQSLSMILIRQEKYEDATRALEEARAIFRSIGFRLGEAECTHRLGDVLRMQGHYDEAATMLTDARRCFNLIGNRMGVAQCTQGLGDILRVQERYDEATLALKEAKSAFLATGTRLEAAQCMTSLAQIFRVQNQQHHAIAELEQAETLFQSIGNTSDGEYCAELRKDITREQREGVSGPESNENDGKDGEAQS